MSLWQRIKDVIWLFSTDGLCKEHLREYEYGIGCPDCHTRWCRWRQEERDRLRARLARIRKEKGLEP